MRTKTQVRFRRRFAIVALLGLALTVFSAIFGAGAAWAHGENAQESWLRMNTVAFWNVSFSTDTVKQGETVTITGTAKVLETWPKTLKGPDTAYVSVVAPGPVFLMKDRTINGQAAPASIYVQKGSVYNFSMTIQGRIPGRYHVHPSFAVKGAGSLIGPGQWITVQKNPAGFSNPLTLYNGKTVNLESYGLAWPVNGFSILTFVVGLAWLLYWIVPKPTVSRLAVTSQLSVNDDGGDAVGLITRKDHRAMNIIALVAALLLIGGWIYEARAFPVKIPQQVDRFAIPSAPAPATIATASMSKVTYDTATQTLTMTVQATNQSDSPVQMKDLHIAGLRFANPAASQGGDGQVTVEPAAPIAPKQTQTLTMTIRGGLMEQQRLIPIGAGQSNTYMTMVADFQNAAGVDNFLTISQFLTPIFD
jgi:methane/ammonia monooxygenase subunit B